MIQYCEGSIFDSGASALVNPVNCVGVSGAGLALEFKRRFPRSTEFYEYLCESSSLLPGMVLEIANLDGREERLLYFSTKEHWGNSSKLEWIRQGCAALRGWGFMAPGASVALSAVGCGLGGLPWAQVREIMEDELGESETLFLVYPPKAGTSKGF